jgi:hypothetical protein
MNVWPPVAITFHDALAAVEAALGEPLQVTSRPRSKVKADNGFDASWVKSLFPDLVFTSLQEGVLRTYEERYAAQVGLEAS